MKGIRDMDALAADLRRQQAPPSEADIAVVLDRISILEQTPQTPPNIPANPPQINSANQPSPTPNNPANQSPSNSAVIPPPNFETPPTGSSATPPNAAATPPTPIPR